MWQSEHENPYVGVETGRWTSLFKSSITAFFQELQSIKEPDVVLKNELAVVHDRTRGILERFALHPTFDSLPRLQAELLEYGGHKRNLELAHVKRQEQHTAVMEKLAGRMLREQFHVLGPERVYRLIPEFIRYMSMNQCDQSCSCSVQDDMSDSVPASEHNSTTIGTGYSHVQNPTGKMEEDGEPCQTVQSTVERSITWCSLRGRDQTKYDRERPGFYDAIKKRASLIRKTSRSHREDTPSPVPDAASRAPYQHGDAEKRLICDVGQDLCNKARKMGVEGRTTCIVIYKNPVHGEWVSAGHIDQGDVIPSLDSVVAEHMGLRQEGSGKSPSIKAESE